MGVQQVTKVAESLVTQGVKKLKYVTPTCRVGTAEELGLKLEQLASDTAQIHKSPLSEITNYLKGVAREGKDFKPTLENPNSVFAQYYTEIQSKIFKPKINIGAFKSYIFKNADKLHVTKEEYWKLVDEICADIQKEVQANPLGLRKEIVEKSGQIQKWAEIFATQHKKNGKEIFSKFYDKQMYDNAVKEYTQFVEELTGKKVLIGCPSRMNFSISSLGIFNNSETYKNVDYILIGHGKGSSLITDITHPNTWRFSDNDKSIYEFIEQNVPKGKKVLVTCCETDGLNKAVEAGVITPKEINYIKEHMPCIGNEVHNYWNPENAVKYCESGTRHIIGQCHTLENEYSSIGACIGFWDTGGFTLNYIKKPQIVNYMEDFSKYKVENIK